MIKPTFAFAKAKVLITVQLISAIAFATQITVVQSLYFLKSKVQAPSPLLWLYSPVFVGPGRKVRIKVFS